MSNNLAINPTTGDLLIGRGATRVGGAEFVLQLLTARLQTILGEWVQDPSLGIDYIEMMGRKAPLMEFERATRILILETNGVRALNDLVLTPDYRRRVLTITFSAETVYGTIEVNSNVGASISGRN